MKNFTVTIELDCSPRLEAVLQAITAFLPAVNKSLTKSVTAKDEYAVTAASAEVDVKELQKAVQEVEKPEEAAKPKEITNDDIRSHIKACRERVLSELSGDAYADAHNLLNQQLRKKVAEFGVEKASELPQEHRPAFIAFCDGLNEVEVPF